MLFGKKRKTMIGTQLSTVLSSDERKQLLMYLTLISARAESDNIKSTSKSVAQLIQKDEPLIGSLIQSIITVVKNVEDTTGRNGDMDGILDKLESLL